MDEESIFAAALDIDSPAERQAYLAVACRGDRDLRGCVDALLNAHNNPDVFLEPRDAGSFPTVDESPAEWPGTVIGPYTLLEQVGEGGMGLVFMAEQLKPVRRLVALKVVKPGMDTRQVVARFEAERQALALMDHPNIAKVHDAGTTPAGRPYFVMELVRGMPLTDFCDQHRLDPRHRLALFTDVCRAVQHAHTKGIIHRDLKPSNVLVTLHDSMPVPKVIDFGIAKATGERLTDRTLVTQFSQVVGTPLYMSPEQAEMNGLDVDTRSDVYALGVLLYELLTGATPFDPARLRSVGCDEVFRILREEEPPRPSRQVATLSAAAVSTISERRGVDARRLRQLLCGELDWIVMKCLEKDRNRRYESASALAADVRRYLDDEPVQACPPSAWYRFLKLARRHKAALAIITLVAAGTVMTVAGLVVNNRLVTREQEQTAAALDRVLREKQRADENLGRARQAVKQYLLKTSENVELRAADLHDLRKQLLETAIPFYVQFAQESRDDSRLDVERAQTHYDLGLVRQDVGDLERALTDLSEAESIYRRLARAAAEATLPRQRLAETVSARAGVLQQLGRRDVADGAYRVAFDDLEALAAKHPSTAEYRESLARVCSNWGELLSRMSRSRDAETLIRRAIELREALLSERPNDPALRVQLATAWNNLGAALSDQRKTGDAEQAHQTAANLLDSQLLAKLELAADIVAKWQKARGNAFNNLGAMQREAGRFAEALEANRTSVQIKEQLADRFPSVPQFRQELAASYNNQGIILSALKRPAETRVALEKAARIYERLVAGFPTVPDYAVALAGTYVNLGRNIGDMGELEASLSLLTSAIDVVEAHYRRDRRIAKVRETLLTASWARAMTLSGLKRHQQALQDWDRAIELDDGRYQITLRLKRASNLLNLKDHARATADAQVMSESANATAADLYNATRIYALSAKFAAGDEPTAETYAARAVLVLHQALAKGFKDLARLQKDSDLDALRAREDFQRLLKELEAADTKR